MAEKITKDTILKEIIENHPKAAEHLLEKYQLHCMMCAAAAFETIEQGLAAHGISDEEIKKIIKKLNSF